MIFYDLSLNSPVENLVCDDMLLRRAQEGLLFDDVLRLWESPVLFVVLGIGTKPDEDVKIDACRRDHVEILRRSSGGGTVLQGPGCLNFSFIYSKHKHPVLCDLHRSYTEILNPVIALLKSAGVDTQFQPVSDLALTGTRKKISGNAQRRLKNHILHHGTILYDFDPGLIEQYLHMPKHVPEYRAGRSHQNFVGSVALGRDRIRQAFLDYFQPSKIIRRLDSSEEGSLKEILCREASRYHIQTAY